ncbi:hypothetical protein [Rathayibacter sp. AY1E1]|uniref:hypothetical protein n=1 Tax=Rathayibacter sp. AY1E1 TaxID=2080549 RepID=UPI0011AFF172|nr:hypothetical protein [Rathayibacter sp. AY1E1]
MGASGIENVDGCAAYVRIVFTGKSADVSYYLTDPQAAGFGKEGGATAGPLTDEQKAERRIFVANNKAWYAAETVCRGSIASLLSRTPSRRTRTGWSPWASPCTASRCPQG